jgi:hypothetical protein
MMAVYNRYRVYNVKLKITAVSDYTTGPSTPLLVAYPANINTAASTSILASELPFAHMMLLGSPYAPPKTMNIRYNTASVLGYA